MKIEYDGESTASSLIDFLKLVEAFKKSERMSEEDMMNGILHLLAGRARIWYLANSRLMSSWEKLKNDMKGEFLPKNYDYNLLDKIRARKQRAGEDFGEYFTHMKVLFDSLSSAPSEQYKLYVVQANLSPKYANAIAPILIRSLNDLDNTCRRIDEMNSSMASQSSGLPFEKRNHLSRFGSGFNRSYRDNNSFNSRGPMIHELETNEPEQAQVVTTNGEIMLVDANRRQASPIGCWNCGRTGHSFTQCPEPRDKIFCFRCGKANVTTTKCNNCSGNEQRNSLSHRGRESS